MMTIENDSKFYQAVMVVVTGHEYANMELEDHYGLDGLFQEYKNIGIDDGSIEEINKCSFDYTWKTYGSIIDTD